MCGRRRSTEPQMPSALMPSEVDINVEGAIRDDYLTYQLEQKIQQVKENLEKAECTRVGTADAPIRLFCNTFASNKGDIQYLFECQMKTSKIKEIRRPEEMSEDHIDTTKGGLYTESEIKSWE